MQVGELDRPVPDPLGGERMHVQLAELPVFNQDRAKAFYVEHFGLKEKHP
jgi:predicted enzyme related to lactoylglutathione lyase